jgi:hypothetical protein
MGRQVPFPSPLSPHPQHEHHNSGINSICSHHHKLSADPATLLLVCFRSQIDVDANPEAAESASIRGVPTFKVFHAKTKVREFSGANVDALNSSVDFLATAK